LPRAALLTFICLFAQSCNQLVKMTDNSYYEKIDPKKGSDHFKIVFSHNINGETHPCGCRKFPLGGLPQVAGYQHEAEKNSHLVYVDTGDMLFPSTKIPEALKDSTTFSAQSLVQAQTKMGLDLFVPGDQDFALGEEYLSKISKKGGFTFLLSNLKKGSAIKSKKFSALKAGEREVYFLGVVNPNLLSGKIKNLFEDPVVALKKVLKALKKEKGSLKNKTIILLSHSGMEYDKFLAKKFPELDWIIGAHSQSFLKEPEVVGKVNIVQALSRNHYMGEIKIPFNVEKEAQYKLVAIDEHSEKKMPDNPFISWLAKYKSELDKIQKTEQKKLVVQDRQGAKATTYIGCSECHKEQTDFWQETSHALAWQTLVKSKAANNPECIQCHSLNFQKPSGFSSSASVVQGESLNEKKLDQYWKEVNSVFKGVDSIRALAAKKREALSDEWIKIDHKRGVERNFANVQCLHCHNQHPEHPFEMEKPAKPDYSVSCLSCHTRDQSPEWYHKDQKGLATEVNKTYVDEKVKELACPKL
ncbi:MAG: multiheme c-type cytochrome, partial [Bacteriovoracaceae bacterium]